MVVHKSSTVWCKALLEYYFWLLFTYSDSDFINEAQHLKQKASLSNGFDGEASCEFKGAEKDVKAMLQFCPASLFKLRLIINGILRAPLKMHSS